MAVEQAAATAHKGLTAVGSTGDSALTETDASVGVTVTHRQGFSAATLAPPLQPCWSDGLDMIAAHGLTKLFGSFPAVDSVDFDIPRGQVVGFLGPNGAGKTTTIRMIAGFLPPTRGRIEIEGQDVARHWRHVRQRIGYLPESAPLYTEMRVTEYLKFRSKLFGIGRSRRRAAIDLALKRCSLVDVQNRPIHQLSKGYRQRVGLAAALLHEPPVLILDEPTVGLDPSQVREVRALIRQLAGQHTILLSTHILPEVEVTCDRIIMIARGRIRAQGTLDELRGSRSHAARVIVETDLPKASQFLEATPGVAGVEAAGMDGRWLRLHVTAANGAGDLRERLAAAIGQRQGLIRELRMDQPTLENLFVKIVSQADAEFEARSAAQIESGGRSR